MVLLEVSGSARDASMPYIQQQCTTHDSPFEIKRT
jgi:hypothetical protein